MSEDYADLVTRAKAQEHDLFNGQTAFLLRELTEALALAQRDRDEQESGLAKIGEVMRSGGMTDAHFLAGAVTAMREHLLQAEARVAALEALLREALRTHDESLAYVKQIIDAERDGDYMVADLLWARAARAALGEGRER
jgi:hypothetical protein